MIEREAQVDKDRPLIAGVIYNRLAANNTLGIDATLLYDDPTPDGTLSSADLAADTPYNTRMNAGLPPTPIASPGEASLEAALHPAHTDYFYYVACPPDGPRRAPVRRHLPGAPRQRAGVPRWVSAGSAARPASPRCSGTGRPQPVARDPQRGVRRARDGLDLCRAAGRARHGACRGRRAPRARPRGGQRHDAAQGSRRRRDGRTDRRRRPVARGQHDRVAGRRARGPQHGCAGVRAVPGARRGVRSRGPHSGALRRRRRRQGVRAGAGARGPDPDRGRPRSPRAPARSPTPSTGIPRSSTWSGSTTRHRSRPISW